jgi:hypothetical protein
MNVLKAGNADVTALNTFNKKKDRLYEREGLLRAHWNLVQIT